MIHVSSRLWLWGCAVLLVLAWGCADGDGSSTTDGADVGTDTSDVDHAPDAQGELGGPCYPNATCNAGLECVDDLCRVEGAEEGELGGPCGPGGTCAGDLECRGDLCREARSERPPPASLPDNLELLVNPLAGDARKSGETLRLVPGGTVRLRARVLADRDLIVQTPDRPVVVDWTSSDTSVVEVDTGGVATGIGNGSAVVTATVQGTDVEVERRIEVVEGDLTGIYIEPERALIDIGGSFVFEASATDRAFAPRALECGTSSRIIQDESVVSATYNDTRGAETLQVSGVGTGFTVLDFDCLGFAATPVILEVKPSVRIPNPSPSSPGNFGVDADIALDGPTIHMASYDSSAGSLVYSVFNRSWSSSYLDGTGDYGRASRVVLDPLNNNAPLICATHENDVSCWLFDPDGFWDRIDLRLMGADAASYEGDLNLLVDSAGTMYLAAYDAARELLVIAQNGEASRTEWEVQRIPNASRYHAIALDPTTESLRVAMSTPTELRYGAWVEDAQAWVFETLDDEAPGQGVRLGIGTDNRPQVVYYKNGNLIHAVRARGAWRTSVVEPVTTSEFRFGFALNWHNEPRVSYYDSNAQTMRFAYRLRPEIAGTSNRWRIETPIAGSNLGRQSAMVLDEMGRAHIAFYDQSQQQIRYFVEPHWLDYAPMGERADEPPSNTAPDGAAANLDAPDGFVGIRGGLFTMGSPEDEEGRLVGREAQVEVILTRNFFLQATPVTRGQYTSLMESNPSDFVDCGTDCPVVEVSWFDAVMYANALSALEGLDACYSNSGAVVGGVTVYDCEGYRLPTEAEWEYAARAGTVTATYNGDLPDTECEESMPVLDPIAWYRCNSNFEEGSGEGQFSGGLHPVGLKEPNAWGLYDMLGNVWEWTDTWYDDEHSDGVDPEGPSTGSRRVIRGGSWRDNADYARAGSRGFSGPGNRNFIIGIRLARTAP